MAKRRNDNGAAENNSAAKPAESTATYFLSLTLRNVRCFGDEAQTLDLSDREGRPAQWTVLLGNNGTGKTTILQALAGFELIPYGVAPHIIVQASFGSPPETVARSQLFLFFSPSLVFPRLPDALATIEVEIGVGTLLGLSGSQYDSTQLRWQITGSASTWTPGPTFVDGLQALKCYAYGASRRFSLKGLPGSESDDATASLYSDDANLRNAEDWLLRLDYVAKASEQATVRERQVRQRDLITALLIDVLPEVDEIRFDPGAGTHPSPKVEAKTPYGWVAFRQLGHGYRTLIAWMVDFVSRLVERYPNSPNPLEAPAVVLVDEIDLHMHPEWQRKVMSKLTESFPNAQFIVTAHSPLIVQAAAEDANIALLRREGDHVVIDNDVGNLRGMRIDQLLTTIFDLPSARPPQYDAIFERRKELLLKTKLTEKEKKELAQLQAKVDELPFGESPEQRKTMELIQRTLDRLEKREQAAK